MLHPGENEIDGYIVVVTFDSNSNVTNVIFPTIKDAFGNPMSINFQPGVPNATAQAVINAVLAQL